MNCPRCGGVTSVINSRSAPSNTTRRRRQCDACGHRFTTYESTVNQAKLVEQRRSASRNHRSRLTPEERQAQDKRGHMRREARAEARRTGEPVKAIYERWGVT